MTACQFQIVKRAGLLVVLAGLCNWPVAAQQFQIVNRTLVSSSRATRTQIDYTYRVDVRNTGVAEIDVRATVTSSSPDTIVIDGELECGDMSAGQVVSSVDTFTIRQNREVAFDPAVLSFQFRFGSTNAPPIANAGPDQIVTPGQVVQLDGSGSSDPDGTIVQYTWTYVGSTPPGLPASLSDPGSVKPTVYIGAAGVYVFQLVVKDNGGLTSAPAKVTIRTGPVANAGPDQTVKVGDTAQLDGTASFDPGGGTLTYAWVLSVPVGSHASLSDTHSARPTFIADVVGLYHADLTVNNGLVSSAPDGVDITAIAKEGLLMCGDLLSGSIDRAGQTNQYTLAGQAGRIVTMTLTDTGGFTFTSAAVTVFAPSGASVVNFLANSQRQIPLPESGTYLVQVTAGNLAGTGTYNLGIVCRNPVSPVVAALSCGALPQGTITAAAQVNQYTFDGQAGRIVTMTLTDTAGFTFTSAAVTLFAPSGASVASFLANSQQQITLPETGTYLMQVMAGNLAGTGTYNLGLVCRNPAAPVISALSCGALPQGTITAAAQVNQYTFDGQAGRIVTMTLTDTADFTFTSAAVTLFAPSGASVVSFLANSQQQITLPETGTYVMQVMAGNLAGTGTYNLGLVCRNPAAPVIAALSCGALPQGAITAAAQVNQYTFDGQAGRIVTMTLTDTAGFTFTSAAVTLFAPSGASVVSFLANSQRQITLPETGTYLMQVMAGNLAGTGTYNLGLVCRNPAAPVIAALSCGALPQGTITAAAQVNQYTFDGQAGRIVTMTLTDTADFTFTSAAVTLFAPSGASVVSFLANSQRQITLPETGTYLMQVMAGNLAGTGTYNLGLVCRNPASPVIAALSCGALPQGTITAAAQVNQYTFDGQAGRIVTMTLTDTAGFTFTSAAVTLFAPSGASVASFLANSQQQITLPETGTYLMQVMAGNLAGTGTYNLGLVCRNPAAPVIAALSCGALPQGTITAAAQVNQYTFDGQASRIVTMTLTDTADFTFTSAAVTLFAPSGASVVSFLANSQRQITLPETGTYVVQLMAGNLAGTGTYNLGLVCP